MSRPAQRRASRAEGTTDSYVRALTRVAEQERELARLRTSLENMLGWAHDANDWRIACCQDPAPESGGHRKCREWKQERDEARAALAPQGDTNG